jgi:hypothetical protein
MEILLKFILATAGLTWILGKSRLFRGFREYLTYSSDLYNDVLLKSKTGRTKCNILLAKVFYFFSELLKCSGCLGTWCGLLVSIAMFQRFDLMYMFVGAISSLVLIEKIK